jgi:hypothetical protein
MVTWPLLVSRAKTTQQLVSLSLSKDSLRAPAATDSWVNSKTTCQCQQQSCHLLIATETSAVLEHIANILATQKKEMHEAHLVCCQG